MSEREDRFEAVRTLQEEFRRELEVGILPLREESRAADEGALRFAQIAIQSGFLLNGGAFVAVPAIVALFSIDARAVLGDLVWTAGLFVAGLLAAWLASVAGYFSMNRLGATIHEQRRAMTKVLSGVFSGTLDPSRRYAEIEAHRDAGATALRRFGQWRLAGILLCFVSLACFVAGATVGGMVVLMAPQRIERLAPLEHQNPPPAEEDAR